MWARNAERHTIRASFDSTKSWRAIDDDALYGRVVMLGFTTPAQGVAIVERDGESWLAMSRDGGRTWDRIVLG